MEMYDFSSVMLPGVGGSLNPSTAISSDKLAEMNKIGKKWRTDKEGNLYYHNEQMLKANQASREKRSRLVNRDRNENMESEEAMKEIMGRKRARVEAFRELKKMQYNFADDSELMSMPQSFSSQCSKSCKGPGKCGCSSCKHTMKKAEYREWPTAKRERLKAGKVQGEFAGPDMSFPIAGVQDVAAAWSSVGRASNPRQIMSRIIEIAKKYGWEAGLPKTVRDRLTKGESGLPTSEFREWSKEKRQRLEKGEIKGEFAGPGTSFPISSPKDVSAAWSSVGRADNPRQVMTRIIQIAKKYGWESGLPESVRNRLKEDKSDLPD